VDLGIFLADDLGGERRVLPLLLDDRDDVEVGHDHERVGCRCPRPAVQERMPVDDLARASRGGADRAARRRRGSRRTAASR
jgi:hypothetical protein